MMMLIKSKKKSADIQQWLKDDPTTQANASDEDLNWQPSNPVTT